MDNKKNMQKLIIHPANDIFGRWWAIFQDGEEIRSFNRDSWTLDEVKGKLREQFNDIEFEVDGENKNKF